jgi:hypothetical protein
MKRVRASRIRELNNFRKLGSSLCPVLFETDGEEKFGLVLAKQQGSNYRGA